MPIFTDYDLEQIRTALVVCALALESDYASGQNLYSVRLDLLKARNALQIIDFGKAHEYHVRKLVERRWQPVIITDATGKWAAWTLRDLPKTSAVFETLAREAAEYGEPGEEFRVVDSQGVTVTTFFAQGS